MVPSSAEVGLWLAGHRDDVLADCRTRTLRVSAEIVPTIEEIVAALDAAEFSSKDIFGVRLALEEALVNAVKHGNKGDPTKEVHLRYHLTPECIVVEIEDQGSGFNPEDVPDPFAPENLERPCGRGLLLMRHGMTWVRYDHPGNRVTMCRLRAGE